MRPIPKEGSITEGITSTTAGEGEEGGGGWRTREERGSEGVGGRKCEGGSEKVREGDSMGAGVRGGNGKASVKVTKGGEGRKTDLLLEVSPLLFVYQNQVDVVSN